MTAYEQLLNKFFTEKKYWVDGTWNRGLIARAADNAPLDWDRLLDITRRIKNDLMLDEAHTGAWADFVAQFPDYNLDANKWSAFESLGVYEKPSKKIFTDYMLAGKFTKTAEATERDAKLVREESRRNELIDLISKNGATTVQKDRGGRVVAVKVYTTFGPYGQPHLEETGKLQSMTLSQLEDIATGIQARRTARTSTPAELRATSTTAFAQYEPLPETYNGAPWTAKLVGQLNADDLRKLIRKHSADALTMACRRNASLGVR